MLFPEDLRVLVVDDDPLCLKIVESMLKTNKYEALAVEDGTDALNLLRETHGGFDVVLTDIHMPGMDGFELLSHIRREFSHLPVIIMSADDDQKTVARGLENGACFFISKPVSQKNVQTLWQHVLRRRLKNKAERTNQRKGSGGESSIPEKVSVGDTDPCGSSNNEDNNRRQEGKGKRPRAEASSDEVEEEKRYSTTNKKPRVIWSNDLHNQFLAALDKLGLDTVPKKILEFMDAPGVRRENVASHLQKHRMFLRRLNEANQPVDPKDKIYSRCGYTNPPFMNKKYRYPQVMNQQSSWMQSNPRQGNNNRDLNVHSSMPSQPRQGDDSQGLNARPLMPIQPRQRDTNQDCNTSNSYLPLGTELTGIRIGAPLCPNRSAELDKGQAQAPIHGDSSASFDKGKGIMHVDNQPPLARLGHLGSERLEHNFGRMNLQGQNNLPIVGNVGPLGNFNRGLNFNSINNFTGIQMTGSGGLSVLSRTGPIGGESSNNNNLNSNLIDEICRNDMTVADAWVSPYIPDFNRTNSSYEIPALLSSCGLASARQFPSTYTNAAIQQEQLPPLQAPPAADHSGWFASTSQFPSTFANVAIQQEQLPPLQAPPPADHSGGFASASQFPSTFANVVIQQEQLPPLQAPAAADHSGGLAIASQFPSESTNVAIQQEQLPLLQAPPPADHSGGLAIASQFPSASTNVAIQQEQLPPLQEPPPEDQQQCEGEEPEDWLLHYLMNGLPDENNPIAQQEVEEDFANLISNNVNQTADQQQGGEPVVDPEFNINAYQVEDDPPAF